MTISSWDPEGPADRMMLKLWNATFDHSTRNRLVDEVQTTLCNLPEEKRSELAHYIVNHSFSDHRFPSHGYGAIAIRNDERDLIGFQFEPHNPSSIKIYTDCGEK